MEQLQYGLVGTRMDYYPAYRPRFVYGFNRRVLSDCYVLYWQYEKQQNELGRIAAFPKYWEFMQRLMPVGIGKTDTNGYLREICYQEHLTLFMSMRLETEISASGNIYHLSIDPKNRRRSEIDIPRKLNYKSMSAFTPNKPMAFMVLPIDLDQSLRLEIRNLLQFGRQFQGQFLWMGRIKQDHQQISLPMHSLSWAAMLKNANRRLADMMRLIQSEYIPFLQDLVPFNQLQRFLEIYASYPQTKHQWPQSTINQMMEILSKSQSHLYQQYQSKIQDKIARDDYLHDDAAALLWELVSHDDLASSQLYERRYFSECIKNGDKPLMRWSENYLTQALTESLRLLAHMDGERKDAAGSSRPQTTKVNYCVLVYEKYCAPLMEAANASTHMPRNGFGELLSFSINLLPSVAGNFPGPPSLLMAIINSIGLYHSKRFVNQKISEQRIQKLLSATQGLLRLLNGNVPIDEARWWNLVGKMRMGEIRFNKNTLAELAIATFTHPRSEMSAFAYQGLMRLILYISLLSRIKKDDSQTLKHWSGVIASGANLSLSFEKLISNTLRFRGRGFGLTMGFVGLVAEACLGFFEAYEEYDKDVVASAIIGTGALFNLLAGFFFIATSIEILLAISFCVSLLIVVASSIGLLIYKAYRHSAENMLLNLLGDIEVKYRDDTVICDALGQLYLLNKQMHWRKLSWRALVPLYEAGYRQRAQLTIMMQFDGSLEILNNYVSLVDLPTQFQVLPRSQQNHNWRDIFANDCSDNEIAIASLRKFFTTYFSLAAAKKYDEIFAWRLGVQMPRELPLP